VTRPPSTAEAHFAAEPDILSVSWSGPASSRAGASQRAGLGKRECAGHHG
jgi:hypothetical protein